MIEKSIRNPKVHPISPNYVFEGTRLVNVDCVEDLSDIYPNGWTSEFRALHASLHEGEQVGSHGIAFQTLRAVTNPLSGNSTIGLRRLPYACVVLGWPPILLVGASTSAVH